MEGDAALTRPGIIRTSDARTVGSGGLRSSGMKYVHELILHLPANGKPAQKGRRNVEYVLLKSLGPR